ncbi:hypothetical protein C8J56DRAFT_785829 [Mycena floridula]|nr:hypothetical protein C8J56DRAFT_785829 [Mycena floridula]
MKFLSTIFAIATFCACISAQSVFIGFPSDGSTITAGTNMTVEVDRPDTLSGSEEVAIVIGFTSCSPNCAAPDLILGNILYNGPYAPKFQTTAPGSKPPHQNFTVTIPAAAQAGKAQLNLAHFFLLGVCFCRILAPIRC